MQPPSPLAVLPCAPLLCNPDLTSPSQRLGAGFEGIPTAQTAPVMYLDPRALPAEKQTPGAGAGEGAARGRAGRAQLEGTGRGLARGRGAREALRRALNGGWHAARQKPSCHRPRIQIQAACT